MNLHVILLLFLGRFACWTPKITTLEVFTVVLELKPAKQCDVGILEIKCDNTKAGTIIVLIPKISFSWPFERSMYERKLGRTK